MSAEKCAGLGWGQRYMWLRYQHLPSHARHEAHIVLRLKVAGGITLARLRATLNYLVRRHENLRTTFHVDATGEPRQRVNPPGAVALVTVTAEPDGTPAPADVVDALSTTEFDLENEWPIRACIITAAGVPTQLVLVLNHLAFDAWSIDRLERELSVLGEACRASRPVTLEPVRHQPSDLLRHEESADAAAGRERALAYWRSEIAELEANPFGGAGAGPAHSATLTSPAMLAASRRIAARHQVWPFLVHVTAYSMVLAAYTGARNAAVMAFTGNRDSGPYADCMTCMFSPLLLRVDCSDDPTFGQLLRRVAECFDRGRGHSYLPYDEFEELVSLEGFRRGRNVRVGSELNFISQSQLRSRARSTRFTRNPEPAAWAHSGTDVYFRIYEWQDAVVLMLNALDGAMGAEAAERFLRGYEAVLLAHDDGPADPRIGEVAALAGFPAADAAVDLDRVGEVIAAHPAVRAAHCALTAAGDLVARVVADPPVTPAELRTHVLALMYDNGRVRCPDRFLVYDRTAEHGRWDEAVPVADGNGRPAERAGATGPAERSLAAAVARVNGLGEVSMSDSYPVAGGRVLRIPQVLAQLRDCGWSGLSVYQLASARPLRALADRLTPVPDTEVAFDRVR